jgi:hypothetical protein
MGSDCFPNGRLASENNAGHPHGAAKSFVQHVFQEKRALEMRQGTGQSTRILLEETEHHFKVSLSLFPSSVSFLC